MIERRSRSLSFLNRAVVIVGSIFLFLLNDSSVDAAAKDCRSRLQSLKSQWSEVSLNLEGDEVAVLDFGGGRFAVTTLYRKVSSRAAGLFKDRIEFRAGPFPRDSLWRFWPFIRYKIYRDPEMVKIIERERVFDGVFSELFFKYQVPFGFGIIDDHSDPVRTGTLIAWPRIGKILVLAAIVAAPLLIKTPAGFKNFYSGSGNIVSHLQFDHLEKIYRTEISPVRHVFYETDDRYLAYQDDREMQRLHWTMSVRSGPEEFNRQLERVRIIRERVKELPPAYVLGILRTHLSDEQMKIAAGMKDGSFEGISGESLREIFPWVNERFTLNSYVFEELIQLLRFYHPETNFEFDELMASARKGDSK